MNIFAPPKTNRTRGRPARYYLTHTTHHTHPHTTTIGAEGPLDCYYLTNLIGNPLETTIMVANLMFSGALDELPRLKMLLAHGGGFAPCQGGRVVDGHQGGA